MLGEPSRQLQHGSRVCLLQERPAGVHHVCHASLDNQGAGTNKTKPPPSLRRPDPNREPGQAPWMSESLNQLEMEQFGSNLPPGLVPRPYLVFHLFYLSPGVALQLFLVQGEVFGVGGGTWLCSVTLRNLRCRL